MIAWLATAWNRTLVEFSKFNDDAYKYVFLICPFGMIFAAFFFAVHDYGRVNILISFVAGFFTGALFILLPFGALLLWVFLGIFLSNLTGQKEPTKRVLVNFCFIASAIAVVALWTVSIDFLKSVPIIGDQLTFMFRDDDD